MIDPELYKAAKKGDVSRLSAIHGEYRTEEEAMNNQHGEFLERTQNGNNNILHIAASAGRDNFVAEVLCRFPFLSDQVNSQGDTPLLVAARFGHLEVVKKLTQSTATENGTNTSSSSPPRGAGEELDHHEPEQVTSLTQVGMAPAAGDETNPFSSHPQSGMASAAEDETNPFSSHPATEDQTNSSSSRSSIGEGIVDHQSEQGTIPDSIVINIEPEDVINSVDGATAMEEGPIHLQLDGLIPYHWRVTNEQGTTVTTALHEALRKGHEEVALYLLALKPEQAAFYNLAGESPLFLAAESHCELFMSDVLLSMRPYSTKGPHGQNALHATRRCCGKTISALIKDKPHLLTQRDCQGKAAIHYAVEADYGVLLDEMLEVDPFLALFPDDNGYTPLLTASSRGCWKMFKKILEICPESIEACDYRGRNALHLCKSWNYRQRKKFVDVPAVRELLNVGDNYNNTPLQLAILENDYDKAMFLISVVGIDLGVVNVAGHTALDLCELNLRNLKKQKLMWFHLWRHNAPRGRHPDVHIVPNKFVFALDADLKSIVKTMNLVAILIITVAFTAAFTMPGGFNSSSDDLGLATLIKKTTLKVFIMSDTLALCSSTTVVFLLIWAASAEGDVLLSLVNASWLLLCISLVATLVAFMFGISAVTDPKSKWVEIVVFVVCSSTPFLITPRTMVTSTFATWFLPFTLTRDIPEEIWHLLKSIRKKIKRKIKLQRYLGQLSEVGHANATNSPFLSIALATVPVPTTTPAPARASGIALLPTNVPIDFTNNGIPEGHPHQAPVDDSLMHMSHVGASRTHIPPLANQSADNLERPHVEQEVELAYRG